MNRQTATIILAVITIVIVVIALAPLIPSRERGFSELGILGPDQSIMGYPTRISANQSFLLYGLVGNQEGNVEYYQLLVKVGNQATVVTNTTFAVAPVIATYWHVLQNNNTWLFPMTLHVSQPGTNTRIIFELWSYNVANAGFEYKGLWNQILLNVTST